MHFDNFSKETLDILERSSTPFERRSLFWDYSKERISEKRLQEYLLQWEDVLSKKEGKERLNRYFSFDNINEDELMQMLSPVRTNQYTNIPSWVNVLEQIMTVYSYLSEERFIKTTSVIKIPFENVLSPMLDIYRKEMERTLGASLSWVDEGVLTQFGQSYLSVISKTAVNVLFEKFQDFRKKNKQNRNLHSTSHQNAIYNKFAKVQLNGGFFDLLTKYPVLARILSILTLNFASANAQFLNRLQTDYTELRNHFFPKEKIGKLKGIKTSISDLHKGGESVIILTFENDRQLVYKPKNIDLAENFDQLSEWFNKQDFKPTFKRIKLINKQTYGWVEYIPFKPCLSEKEIQLYYQRAGSLLGLLHLLRTTDCHFENIIANGSFPVLVDCETLVCPNLHPMHEGNRIQVDTSEQFYEIRDSVLRTMLLPKSLFHQIHHNGGFGSIAPLQYPAELGYLNPNTDLMEIAKISPGFSPEYHIPHLDNHPKRIQQYRGKLKEGFKKFYHFLLDRREELTSNQSPLKGFKNLSPRFVFRHTFIYKSILKKLLSPTYLRDGIAYGIQLEMLTRAFLTIETKPMFWTLLKEERRAMLNQDVPYYLTSTASQSLNINQNEKLKDFFEQSSYQAMMDVLCSMDGEDLAFQLKMIDQSILSQKNPKSKLSLKQ